MEKVMQSEAAKDWVVIPGKNDGDEPLYICKATGKVFDKNGESASIQFSSGDSHLDEPEVGTFGKFLKQFHIPNYKLKAQSWTELATLYASKQLPGSWESDSEDENESEGCTEISKTKQNVDMVSSSPSNGPSL
ncbi:hypothetical protein DAPPUDRAFT_110469 [Daphnia pulex]|uniref:Uncharacterized protein n=1 Tax=Daphnia pulex TaxID=6669 RepID=E9H6C3_DAPPU|nr:hypothetical protein DAPPUDRAFT_110469 [Daphnia pulex]|eukprot:EFX72632.1 hypothetical protein DAPPUDRAFT_110469 [Daphnia pulex]